MLDGTGQVILLAGATGDLGSRIGAALVRRGAVVRAVVRPGTPIAKRSALQDAGLMPVEIDFADTPALANACTGANCVVSALNGLEPVMIEQQTRLLDAAVAAGVSRFIPSDFSLDFTKTRPGDNRNLDLRRQFMQRIDAAPIRAQSVLNGMFAELLQGQAPIVLQDRHKVLYWGNADQLLDFTTKDDVAAFTADVALDSEAPRFSRIAGSSVSINQLASLMTRLTGEKFTTLRPGGLGLFGTLIALVRTFTPKSDNPFPAWQGMQYMRDMLSGRGKLSPLDNDRYGKRTWTPVEEVLASALPKR